MKPLFVLLVVFALAAGVFKIAFNACNLLLSGNIAMCVMLCFTALGHFKFADGMAMMLPDFIPYKRAIVIVTGIAEVLLGLALLFTASRYIAGVALIVFLVMVLPANIGAAFRYVNYEQAAFTGKGPNYLWLRIPLQIFFVTWVFYFSVNIL